MIVENVYVKIIGLGLCSKITVQVLSNKLMAAYFLFLLDQSRMITNPKKTKQKRTHQPNTIEFQTYSKQKNVLKIELLQLILDATHLTLLNNADVQHY